jgi:hypothetical protein
MLAILLIAQGTHRVRSSRPERRPEHRIPNGHLITTNGDAVNAIGTQNELVEFTEQGRLVAMYQLDPGAAGAAFGVAATSTHGSVLTVSACSFKIGVL